MLVPMSATPELSGGPIEIVHLAFTSFPADPRVKREALAAAETGRGVVVVAFQGAGEPPRDSLGPVQILRLPGRKSRGGPLSYLVEYVAFSWKCRRLLAHDPRFRAVRVVHVHTLPDFLAWAAAPAQRRGARLILDLHEIFPEFARSKYPGPLGRFAAVIATRIERNARRRADVTITVNGPIEALLTGRGIGRAERIVIVHNSPDPQDLGPTRRPQPRNADQIELIYHGTLSSLYGVDVAVRGVVLAASRGVRIHLTVLGDGPERAALEQLVSGLGATSLVSFEAPIPQGALRERLGRADAGVVPTRLDGMTRYSLSNKLLEYVHLGMPVLGARLPSYGQYLAEDAAWYWNAGDPADLARALSEFAAADELERRTRAERAQRGLAAIAWPLERARLLETYADLLGPPGPATSRAAMRSAARPSP
jgi:glycosyltransferase involved in cell wall biosynthesis